MHILPVEYHYEFYTTKFGAPFLSFKTLTALSAMSKGDVLSHRGFSDFPLKVAEGSEVKIAEIEHIVWEIAHSQIGHKTMVLIEIAEIED